MKRKFWLFHDERSFHATLYTDLELITLTQIKTVISSFLSFRHHTQKFREGRCTFETTNAVLNPWFLDSYEMYVYMCVEAPWAQGLILVCTIGPIQKTRSREREWVNKKETYMIPCFLSLSALHLSLSSNRWPHIFLFAVARQFKIANNKLSDFWKKFCFSCYILSTIEYKIY